MLCNLISKFFSCFIPKDIPYKPVHNFHDDIEIQELLSESQKPSVHWLPQKSVLKDSLLEMTPIDSVDSNFSNFTNDDFSSSESVDEDDLFFSCLEDEKDETIDFFSSVTGSQLFESSGVV